MCEPGKPCPGAGYIAGLDKLIIQMIAEKAIHTWERLRLEAPDKRLRLLAGMQRLQTNPKLGDPLMGTTADLILNAIILSDFDIEKVPALITKYAEMIVSIEGV